MTPNKLTGRGNQHRKLIGAEIDRNDPPGGCIRRAGEQKGKRGEHSYHLASRPR